MEITELMAVMKAVEEDHRQVLDKLQALQAALGCLTGTEKSPWPILTRLGEVNTLLARRSAEHAAEEERTLFPFLVQNLPDEPHLVEDLRHEQDEINHKREEFGDSLVMAQQLGSGISRAILLDVIASGWELLDLLDRHAHAETAAVQKCFSRFLQTIPGM